MGRSPCCDESGLKKGPWTPEEDDKLIKYIHKHGHGSWRALPKQAGLNRCGKSCRLRWTNYLRPDIKRGKFSQEEELTILNLHSVLGNKWSAIATHLPGRTDNEIKNFWNTHLKKKLIHMGFDPMTHRPRTDILSNLPQLIALANLKQLLENPSTWENQAIRLHAEAPQMAALSYLLQPPAANISSDTAAFNLLNFLKATDHSILGQLETAAPPTQLAFLQDSGLQFSHLPDLQNPCSVQTSFKNGTPLVVQGSDHCFSAVENSPRSSSSPWLPPSTIDAPPLVLTDTSNITNNGDACSTSSYGGDQMWSEFLDYPMFHEIA